MLRVSVQIKCIFLLALLLGDGLYAHGLRGGKKGAICSLSLSCIVGQVGCQNPSNLKGKYQNITNEERLVIGFGYKSSLGSAASSFPFEKPIEETDPADRSGFILKTKLALARYPRNFWQDSDLYILGIDFDGKGRVSAFHDSSGIYVDIGGEIHENLIHHELGHRLSALYASVEFKRRWTQLNQASYLGLNRYHKDKDRHQDRKPASYDWSLVNQGFVTRYSQVNFSEDFSEVFSMVLMGSRSPSYSDFWVLYETNEIIRAKVNLVVELIQKIDPSLDVEYFKKQSSSYSAYSLRQRTGMDESKLAELSIAEIRNLVQSRTFFDIENSAYSIGEPLYSESFIDALKSDSGLRRGLMQRLPYVERFTLTKNLILGGSSFHPYYDEFLDTLGGRRSPALPLFESGQVEREENRLRRALEAIEILNEDPIMANYYARHLVRTLPNKSQDPIVLDLRRSLALKILEVSEHEILSRRFLKEEMIIVAIRIDSSVLFDMHAIDEKGFNRLIQCAEENEQIEISESLKKLRKASQEEG